MSERSSESSAAPFVAPPGMRRYAFVSFIAVSVVGSAYLVIRTGMSIRPPWASNSTGFAYDLLVGGALIAVATVISGVAVLLAVLGGVLAGRAPSLFARGGVIALLVAAPVLLLLMPIGGPASLWRLVFFPAELAALGGVTAFALAMIAIAPWAGGFASRRYDQPRVIAEGMSD